MAFEVKMPQLGLTMEEGTVEHWLKHEGDAVKTGDILLEITTDKLTNELVCEVDGVLLKIVAEEGQDIPVQGILAYIGAVGELVGGDEITQNSVPGTTAREEQKTVCETHISQTGRIKISPLARKIAAKLDVEYSRVSGSGTSGRIVRADILAAAESQKTAVPQPAAAMTPGTAVSATCVLPEEEKSIRMAGMRRVVAERMLQSHTEIPVVTQTVKVDVTKLMAFRKQLNEEQDVKYSVNDFVLKAVAKALKNNKHILVSLSGERIIQHSHVNLGMAVGLEDGLIVPVIQDADKLCLEELAETARNLANRARENKLSGDEYQGSTFTVSNLGMFAVESFTPIINQPNAGILGICAIDSELAMDEQGSLYQKQVMRISMTLDHRLMDGVTAAKFEMAVKALLENPMSILL